MVKNLPSVIGQSALRNERDDDDNNGMVKILPSVIIQSALRNVKEHKTIL